MHLAVLTLAGALALGGCTRSAPKPAPKTPPTSAASTPAASTAATPPSAAPRPKAWTVQAAHGVSLAVAADAQPESGPPPGDVRRGTQVLSLAEVFGDQWPYGERWTPTVTPITLGGRRFIKLTLTAAAGEDVRAEAQQVALLPAQEGLRPIWRGPGRVEQNELDQCHSGTSFELSVADGALVITRKGFAEYQAPSEDENSQTPDFDSVKATCKPPKGGVTRVQLRR